MLSPFVQAQAPSSGVMTACFAVQAEAEPGLLPRVLELFAKRGLVPDRLFAQRGARGGELMLDIQVADFTAPLMDQIARALRQIPGVTKVLTAEKVAG